MTLKLVIFNSFNKSRGKSFEKSSLSRVGQLFQRSHSIARPLNIFILLFHISSCLSLLTSSFASLLFLWNGMLFRKRWAKLLNETVGFRLFEFYFVILWWDVRGVVEVGCPANLTEIWGGINLVHILGNNILTLLQISWLALLTFSINFSSSNCLFVE